MRPSVQGEAGLSHRLRVLEDIEEIGALKAAYWRAVDLKRPDDALACLTEGVVIDFDGVPRCEGRDDFASVLRAGALRPASYDMHHGCNSVITLTGPDEARGRWSIDYRGVDARHRLLIHMAGEYDDRYVRVGSKWRIAEMTMRQKSFAIRQIGADQAETQISLQPDANFNALPQ